MIDPWDLIKNPDLCIGCGNPKGEPLKGNLWCRECWKIGTATGKMPDLLDGGKALRRRG